MKKGFTLVELTVVIAIIGILTAVVLTSTNATHQEARDERRQSDLKEIQIDLAQYYEYYQAYPDGLTTGTNKLSTFILGGAGAIPTDPSTNQAYFYAPYNNGTINSSYCVGATLETASLSDNATAACAAENINGTGGVNYMQQPPQ